MWREPYVITRTQKSGQGSQRGQVHGVGLVGTAEQDVGVGEVLHESLFVIRFDIVQLHESVKSTVTRRVLGTWASLHVLPLRLVRLMCCAMKRLQLWLAGAHRRNDHCGRPTQTTAATAAFPILAAVISEEFADPIACISEAFRSTPRPHPSSIYPGDRFRTLNPTTGHHDCACHLGRTRTPFYSAR